MGCGTLIEYSHTVRVGAPDYPHSVRESSTLCETSVSNRTNDEDCHERRRSPAIASGWRRERPAQPEPLTVDRIVATAIEIVDREGLDALSMRRLGTELGAGATSLYWHVKNKDELLDLALDKLFAEIEAPDPELPWRDQLRELAHGCDGCSCAIAI